MLIRQLLTFSTVSKTKNMAQTALALNYSHSTIYGHLEALEKEFNVKLYRRTHHGIELTEQGEVLLTYANQMIELYYAATDSLTGVKQSSIRICASESGDVCIMHRVLSEFVRIMPHMEIEYSKMTVETLLTKLLSNTCDLAVICEFDFQPEKIYSQYLGTLPLVFVATPSTLAAHDAAELPKLLGTMKLSVAIQMMQSVGLKFEDYFSSLGNIGDLDTVRQLLNYHQGVALLPLMYVKKDLESGELSRIPSLMQEIYLDVFVATPSKQRIGPCTQELISLAFDMYNPNYRTRGNLIE